MILAVVKMLVVTTSQDFTKSAIRKVSIGVWLINLVLLSTEHAIFKLKVYTEEQLKYRLLWSTVLTFSAVIVLDPR